MYLWDKEPPMKNPCKEIALEPIVMKGKLIHDIPDDLLDIDFKELPKCQKGMHNSCPKQQTLQGTITRCTCLCHNGTAVADKYSIVARSQKARGVIALQKHSLNVPKFVLIQDASELHKISQIGYPNFTRPCPEIACHGFVESRICKTTEEVSQTLLEAQQVDPNAEILVMEPIKAVCSAIYTPNNLTFGPGNDGATSAKSALQLRCADKQFKPLLQSQAGIEDAPYMECVYAANAETRIVQLRNGPLLKGAGDFCPMDFKVKHVYIPKDEDADLLVWKAKASSFPTGTCVYHKEGGMATHYGVHCVENNVPYFMKHVPVVGESIKAIEQTSGDPEPHEMVRGIGIGTNLQCTYEQGVRLMLFGLHNYPFHRSDIGSRLLGIAAVSCIRLGVAACLGEYRHKVNKYSLQRKQIFHLAWKDLHQSRKGMVAVLRSFKFGNWQGGFGGHKWAGCAESFMFLWDAVLDLMKDPNTTTASKVVDCLNVSVNVVHNNGWMFNKFASSSYMDRAVASDPYFAVESVPALYHALVLADQKPTIAKWKATKKTAWEKQCASPGSLEKKEKAGWKVNTSTGKPTPPPKPKPKLAPKEIVKMTVKAALAGDVAHFQWNTKWHQKYYPKHYDKCNIAVQVEPFQEFDADTTSQAGSHTPYFTCLVKPDGGIYLKVDPKKTQIAHITELKEGAY